MSHTRLLTLALLVSLAANVFAITLGLTLINRAPVSGRLVDPVPTALVERVVGLLPTPAGDALRARLAGIDDIVAAHRTGYRQSLIEAAMLLEADAVDQHAVSRALATARQHRSAIGDQLTLIFVDTVAGLPLETRQAMVRRFLAQP